MSLPPRPTTDPITQFLAEWYVLSAKYHAEYSDWRQGQCVFNALYKIDPDLANEVRGSNVDPFHRNDRISECYSAVTKLLQERKT